MRVGVVADFVASGGDFASHTRQPADIGAGLKEAGGRAVLSQDFEQLGRGFTGAVVESEGDGRPGVSAAEYRRSEPGERRDANRVSQRAGGNRGAGFQEIGELAHGTKPLPYGHGSVGVAAQQVRLAGWRKKSRALGAS